MEIVAVKLRVLDLFSGIGGFSLGLERTGGFETVAFCEIEPFCQKVLAKHWPGVPCYDDVRTLTAASGIGTVDVICGGYPCQPFSTAGKRAGDKDDRHLWPEVRRLLDEFRPAWFIGENVAGHISLGLDEVLSDLEALNYTARPFVVPACAVNAPHRRDRVWIVANGKINGWRQGEPHSCGSNAGIEPRQECGLGNDCKAVANANTTGLQGRKKAGNAGSQRERRDEQFERRFDSQWPTWPVEPNVGRVAHGVPHRVDRLKALGNAVVPQIPELIGRAILEAAA